MPALRQAAEARSLARDDRRNGAASRGAVPVAGLAGGPRPGGQVSVLSWDGVSVDFEAKRAVNDVTLAIDEGEWVAMIGANGSGQEHAYRARSRHGHAKHRAGQLPRPAVRPGKVFENAAHVALLLQAADEMLFEETVIGELKFGSKFRALPPDPVLDVDGAIEFFGFRGLEQTSPWELSQGGRQRLALGALLVGAPGVLVLDEPTTGQDAERMRSFLRLLEAVRKRTGLTVLTVTHDIRGLAARAARIVLLGEGEVRMDGPTRQVFARTEELKRWGVLAPPLARLQVALLGQLRGRAADCRRGGGCRRDLPRPCPPEPEAGRRCIRCSHGLSSPT